MLKQSIRKMNINIILMNETNTKWTSTNISKIEKEMKEIDRAPIVLTSDGKEWETTSSDYLPGGVMNVILSKCSLIFQQNNVTKGRLGNWLAFSLQHKKKKLEIITIYRIPRTSSNGVSCSLTQYNRINRKINSTTSYRKELLNDIREHLRKNPDINDVIISGDYNQYLGNNEIKKFHENIEVHEIHPIINNILINQIGKTYKHGSNPIDSIAASSGVIDFIDGCKLLDYNDILESDHRGYVINSAIEDYFNKELCEWDNLNKVMLNPARRSHREKFAELLEEQLDIYLLENDLYRMQVSYLNHELEQIDETITTILNTATKKVEGMRRTIPFSNEKEKRRSMVLYCKMKLRQLKGAAVDLNLIESRKQRVEMNDVIITNTNEVEEWVEKVKES